SRRRHTRFSRDWSSDVCSSDLEPLKHKIEHFEEKVVEEIHHVEEKALEFVADGGLGSYSTPGVEAAREVLDNLKKADEQKLVERSEERRVGKECRYRGSSAYEQ